MKKTILLIGSAFFIFLSMGCSNKYYEMRESPCARKQENQDLQFCQNKNYLAHLLINQDRL